VELKGYIQVAKEVPGGWQSQVLYLSNQWVRGNTAYTIPRPMVVLIDSVAAVPAVACRDDDPPTQFVLDLSRWQLVDFGTGRTITPEFAETADPFKLLPLAERYLREARRLDSLGVEQWLARLMNESSTDAHVGRPALGSGQ
jgi:hypothetical protein